MKQCSRCKEEKPIWSFYRKSRNGDGLMEACKDCCKKSNQDNYLKNKTKILASVKRREQENRARNKDASSNQNLFELYASDLKHCVTCKTEKSRSEFPNNSRSKDGLASCCTTCRKECLNIKSRFARYGISVVEFDEMMLNQGGMCAICDKEAKLHIDHNHTTGKVRALLCMKCNTALGHLEDSVELVTKAANYLKKYLPT